MDRIKKFEPLWGVWRCESVLGKGGFGKVYKAVRHDGDHIYYSAVKHISVPDDDQLDEARKSGMYRSEREIADYFNDVARDVQREIDLMYRLKANTNIVSYEDHMIIPKPDGIGSDIFIRMELLQDLSSIMSDNMSAYDAVKIGSDICTALEVCARSKIIHRDIKPSNIFVNENGDYKLGDFGIARVLSNTTMGVSKKGTYSYMAPEIYKCEPANFTSDIYSLGVVLYRILNNNRLPFMPVSERIRAQDQEAALLKTVSGVPMPPPINASSHLAAVILKACSYNMRDRFRSASEFRDSLNAAFQIDQAAYQNTPYPAPPAVIVSEKHIAGRSIRTSLNRKPLRRGIDNRVNSITISKNQDKKTPSIQIPPKNKSFNAAKKNKKKIIVFSAIIAALLGLFALILLPDSFSNTSPVPDGLEYQISNNTITITKYRSSEKDLVIPQKIEGLPVTKIGTGAFSENESLESIKLPNGLLHIGNAAFSGCSSLTFIELPDSVISISWYAFYNCTSLEHIKIPNKVKTIDEFTFCQCSSLESIYIPNSVSSIKASAFKGCISLDSIVLSDNLTTIGNSAFKGCLSLDSIYIPNSVTVIGNSAFEGCTSLPNITMPQNVTSISSSLFKNCYALESVELPSGLKSIGSYAFTDCRALTSLTIPESVTSIDGQAFSGCSNTIIHAADVPSAYDYYDEGYKLWVNGNEPQDADMQ